MPLRLLGFSEIFKVNRSNIAEPILYVPNGLAGTIPKKHEGQTHFHSCWAMLGSRYHSDCFMCRAGGQYPNIRDTAKIHQYPAPHFAPFLVLQRSFFSPSTTAARGLPFVLPFQKDGPNQLHLVSHWIDTANALSI